MLVEPCEVHYLLLFSASTVCNYIPMLGVTNAHTVQTLPAVWGLRGQCLGYLQEEASSLSCIQNNLEESFPL